MYQYRDPPGPGQSPIPLAAVVRQLRFVTEGAAGDSREFLSTRERIQRDQTDWWSCLATGFGVANSQDLIGLGRQRSFVHHLLIWVAEPEDRQALEFSAFTSYGRPYCGEPLTKAQLEQCMALTGGGTRPPAAWLMLRDARSLFYSEDYRRAVLDAGTAAELALTAILDTYLAATAVLMSPRR